LAPVVADKPVAGLHEYVVAPLAARSMLLPAKMVAVLGEIVIVGKAFTVTATGKLGEEIQLLPLVTITV
jgi:hypothetical protein